MTAHDAFVAQHNAAKATIAATRDQRVRELENELRAVRSRAGAEIVKLDSEHAAALEERWIDMRERAIGELVTALDGPIEKLGVMYARLNAESLESTGQELRHDLAVAICERRAAVDPGALSIFATTRFWEGEMFRGQRTVISLCEKAHKQLIAPSPGIAAQRAVEDLTAEIEVESAFRSRGPVTDETREQWRILTRLSVQARDRELRRIADEQERARIAASAAEHELIRRARGGDLSAAQGKPPGWLKAIGGLCSEVFGPLRDPRTRNRIDGGAELQGTADR